MSVLDELERSLARAVDAGAAGAPSQARAAESTTAAASRSDRRRTRRGWHVFLTILAAGSLTTGALAATGQLPTLKIGDRDSNPNYQMMTIPGMDTKALEPPTILPMRVEDPAGGPPWALRTFPIGRGRTCAQAGQLYQGKFGLVTNVVDRVKAPSASGPATATTVFQELAPAAATQGVRCGAQRGDGQLVAADRATIIVYPDGTDLRCSNSPAPRDVAPCPINEVTVIRWGFLGPKGKTATFIQPDGRRGPTQQVDRKTGGAYLFAEAVDPKPFLESQAFEREIRARVERKFPGLRRAIRPSSSSTELRQNLSEVERFAVAVADASRQQRRANWRAQQAEAVDATFDGAADRRVAGPGAKGGLLPGIEPVDDTVPRLPSPGSTRVTATFRAQGRAIEVRFASPIALDARPGLYAVSIRGPKNGGRCGKARSTQDDFSRQVAAGDEVLVRVRPRSTIEGSRLITWCPGARYDVRVRHVVRNANKPGLRSEQLVGRTSFTPPAR